MIIPLTLSANCAQNPAPGSNSIGRNYIKQLFTTIKRGGFLVMGEGAKQQYDLIAANDSKYGTRFREFLNAAEKTAVKIEGFPNFSKQKKYGPDKLEPAKHLIINTNELDLWGLNEEDIEIKYGDKGLRIAQYALLEESKLKKDLRKIRSIDLDEFSKDINDFFDLYKWPFTNLKNLNVIDPYVGSDVNRNKYGRQKSGLENILNYLKLNRKKPLQTLNIHTTFTKDKFKPYDYNDQEMNEIEKEFTKLLNYYSSVYKTATIHSIPHKKIEVDGKWKGAPHGRYIGMYSGEKMFCLAVEAGASSFQDKNEFSEGHRAEVIEGSFFTKQWYRYEKVWKASSKKYFLEMKQNETEYLRCVGDSVNQEKRKIQF